jgi:hypothetical protein
MRFAATCKCLHNKVPWFWIAQIVDNLTLFCIQLHVRLTPPVTRLKGRGT